MGVKHFSSGKPAVTGLGPHRRSASGHQPMAGDPENSGRAGLACPSVGAWKWLSRCWRGEAESGEAGWLHSQQPLPLEYLHSRHRRASCQLLKFPELTGLQPGDSLVTCLVRPAWHQCRLPSQDAMGCSPKDGQSRWSAQGISCLPMLQTQYTSFPGPL